MSQPAKTAKDVFLIALDADPADRSALLDIECADDSGLRRQVEALLKVHDEPDSVLDSPRIDLGITGIATPDPSPTIDQPLTEKPGTQIGPYKLLQKLGEGGMGVVYMAEQREPVKRRVALKIIKPGMDTRQVIARFEAERQALAMMDHPNIAKVLDAGTTGSGRPYFAMELVNGISVTKYCDEQHLTPKERLELFVPICQAVQHAHQKGIIHRDLKPSNVLVALYDAQAIPKVIDFGVAKATSQTLTEKTMFTQLGQVVGTLEYMSPEQAQRNQLDIDTRSDIYSLGVLLYELLTGETPFDRTRLRSAAFDEMLRIIREEEPSKPSTKVSSSEALPSIAANRRIESHKLGSAIRGELDWIVMKALEKDRARRYDTASKFAEDVQHYLNDEAVVACPPSRAYRLKKIVRRHKGGLAVSIVMVAIVLAGLVGTSLQSIRATRALGIAETQRDRAVKAEELAKVRLAEAQVARKRTRKALDEMSSEVVDQWLSSQQKLTPEQTAVLRKSVQLYEEFANANKDDLVTLTSAASACLRVGQLRNSLGEHREATEALTRGIEIFENLIDREPENGLHFLGAIDCRRERVASLSALNGASSIEAEDTELLRQITNLRHEFPREIRLQRLLVEAYLDRSARLNHMRRYEESLALLDKAIIEHKSLSKSSENDSKLRYLLARLYGSRQASLRPIGSPDEADRMQTLTMSIIDELTVSEPDNPEYKYAAVTNHLNRARHLHQRKRFESSKNEFQTAIQIGLDLVARFPAIPQYRQRLGQIYLNYCGLLLDIGDTEGASRLAEQSVTTWKQLVEWYPATHGFTGGLRAAEKLLARVHAAEGEIEEALVVISRVIEKELAAREEHGLDQWLYAGLLGSYTTRAAWLSKLGRDADATRDYQSAIEVDPENFYTFIFVGDALKEQGNLSKAVDCYLRATELEPDNGIPFNKLGSAYREMGDLDAAEDMFRKAVQLSQDHPTPLENLAETLASQNKLDEAVACLEHLGEVLERQQKFDQAVACYQRAVALDPTHVAIRYKLGLLLKTQGKVVEAIACFKKVIDVDPAHAEAKGELDMLNRNDVKEADQE